VSHGGNNWEVRTIKQWNLCPPTPPTHPPTHTHNLWKMWTGDQTSYSPGLPGLCVFDCFGVQQRSHWIQAQINSTIHHLGHRQAETEDLPRLSAPKTTMRSTQTLFVPVQPRQALRLGYNEVPHSEHRLLPGRGALNGTIDQCTTLPLRRSCHKGKVQNDCCSPSLVCESWGQYFSWPQI